MASTLLSLNSSLAPRFIKILYIIALIFIALGVILRVGHGVIRITHPPVHHAAMAAMAGQMPSANQSTPATSQSAAPGSRIRRDGQPGQVGFGNKHFGARRFHGPRLGLLSAVPTDQRPLVFGIFRILFALIWGAIAVMVVRVLAELAIAVLTLSTKPRT